MNNFWDTSVWGGMNVFAMLLLGLLAAQAPENPVGTWFVALAFFTVLNIILFRAQIVGIFKKNKTQN